MTLSDQENDIAMVEMELQQRVAGSSKLLRRPSSSLQKPDSSRFPTGQGAAVEEEEEEEEEDPFQEITVASSKGRANSTVHRNKIIDNSSDQNSSRRVSNDPFASNHAEPSTRNVQSRPTEIPNLLAEIMFILVCSTGQLLFGFLTGNVAGLQLILVDLLDIPSSQTPWLLGSFLLANGLSVIVSGPVADLYRPKYLICGAFAWQTMWNIIGVFSLHNKYLFFITRGGQGLSVGILVSSSISLLGRIYQPGLRKTRVFSIMASMAPLGYWLGNLQGGALYHSPKWIFASSSIISGICFAGGMYAIPNILPALQSPGFRSFDFAGSTLAVTGCALLVAGLTQGPSVNWAPYSIVIVVLGLVSLTAFFFVERRVQRPLLPPSLWRVPGFTPLIISYFIGFGSFMAWQFFALQFWLKVQHVSPLTVALYLTPNAIFGVLATFIVSRIAHLVAGHWILAASMIAFALGPVFFLPQSANTIYWALSFAGISLVTFGPDLSFAAASIFVTSSVAKSYQGSAGSLLVTVQNLSGAIMISISESIGDKAAKGSDLERLHSIWWFNFAASICAAVITLVFVRMPKTEEKEHES
ncbi:hypothetical protein CBS101457_001052 [Exobasidium rhododendri]|nr:hypothetical protein CBS101457_001052 [Exobasidium rhododendri]